MAADAAMETSRRDLPAWVKSLSGWHRAGLAFAAGSLSVLAFAPVFAAPVLFLTFPVLVWLIDSSPNPRGAAWDGWWFAFGYFFFNLFWLGEAFLVEAEKFAVLLPFAVTLLPAALAIFWALAIWVAKVFWREGFARLLLLAVVLAVTEWLRGHLFTGLPWNLPGYALTYPVELMQSAALAGVYALTLPAVVIFAGPLVLWFDAASQARAARLGRSIAIAAVPLAVLWIYGAAVLKTDVADVPGVKLRLVQPSVPQREKWMAEHQARIFREHLTMSGEAADGTADGMPRCSRPAGCC
jgi:apolipoprotein N-acyltransferase